MLIYHLLRRKDDLQSVLETGLQARGNFHYWGPMVYFFSDREEMDQIVYHHGNCYDEGVIVEIDIPERVFDLSTEDFYANNDWRMESCRCLPFDISPEHIVAAYHFTLDEDWKPNIEGITLHA